MIKIWYNEGIHILLDTIHILCDPTFTTNENIDYESYIKKKTDNFLNTDYMHVNLILISHGHTDHCDRLDYFHETQIKVIAHPMTINLRPNLFTNLPNLTPIRENETIKFEDLLITAYSSGHCGGSLMYFIIYKNKKILFTGDFNPQLSVSNIAAKPIPCDILIMETTFGDPKFQFPPKDQIYGELYKYLNETFKKREVILMFCQSLGKTQDIVKLIRNFNVNDIKIVLDSYGYTSTKLFEQYYGKINHEINHFSSDLTKDPKQTYIEISELFNPKKKTLIISSLKDDLLDDIANLSRQFGLIEPPIVLLSGLSKEVLQPIIDMYNPIIYQISNHADFNDLITFINMCSPSSVCVFHGYSKEFKKEAVKYYSTIPIYDIHFETCTL